MGSLPLLFLLASCGGGGGSSGDSSLRAELTFTPYADAVFITLNNNSGNLADVVDLTIRALDENGEQVSNVTLRIEDLVRGHNYTIPDGTYLFELIATVRTDTDSLTSRKIRIDYRGVRPDANGRIIVGEVSDSDGDGVVNSEDVDVDGDGLIEIATAEELNAMRYALDGSGRKLSETAELNSTGCGNGADITSCRGYELVANISLAGYRNGSGWQPVGEGSWDSEEIKCIGEEHFSGIFDGNHHRVSDLKINRPDEDCIGFFGFVGRGSEIRNFIIEAETVSGDDGVGVLAGGVNSTDVEISRIINSHILADSVDGATVAGGLVGAAGITRIIASSSVLGSMGRTGGVDGGIMGGLVGRGQFVWIVSSFAVVGDITDIGLPSVGGLVGNTNDGRIISSYAIAGSLGENRQDNIGGLIGNGRRARVASSYGVTQSFAHDDQAGGLIGDGRGSSIAFSYTVSHLASRSGADHIGPLTGAISGDFSGITVTSSYWDSDANNITEGTGTPQNGMALRMPTGYESIYASWDDGADVDEFQPGIDNITIWCDNDWDGEISAAERTDDNRIWDFGTAEEYPAIRCARESPAEQRRWWSLNDQGKPILNRTRLDEVLP